MQQRLCLECWFSLIHAVSRTYQEFMPTLFRLWTDFKYSLCVGCGFCRLTTSGMWVPEDVPCLKPWNPTLSCIGDIATAHGVGHVKENYCTQLHAPRQHPHRVYLKSVHSPSRIGIKSHNRLGMSVIDGDGRVACVGRRSCVHERQETHTHTPWQPGEAWRPRSETVPKQAAEHVVQQHPAVRVTHSPCIYDVIRLQQTVLRCDREHTYTIQVTRGKGIQTSLWTALQVQVATSSVTSSTHSLDRLTGDGSLRPAPDLTITGHVSSGICSEPDVDLQLADHSTYVEDDLADASSPACHRVADQHACWLPDEVLRAQEPILAGRRGFCCRCLAVESGSSLTQFSRRSHTSVFQGFFAGKPRVFVRLILWGSRSSQHIVGQRRRERRPMIYNSMVQAQFGVQA